MRTTRMLALGASVTAGAAALATPALAQYIHIGTVEINRRGDHETQWNRFGGPMEGLRLTARTSNIHCRSIRVQYGNGHWDRVYKGKLHRGRPISVDLRGHRRKLRQILLCLRNAAPSQRTHRDFRRCGPLCRRMATPAAMGAPVLVVPRWLCYPR